MSFRVDRHPRLIERLGDVDAALPDRAGQRLGEDAVRTFLVAGQRARGSVEGDQFARLGIDQSEARRKRRALTRIRIGARRIEHDDARPSRRRRKSVGEIGHADRLDRHVGVAADPSVDRNKIIVSVVLDRPTGEIDERLHIGPGRLGLLQEIAKRRA